jgi:hypothetical protein
MTIRVACSIASATERYTGAFRDRPAMTTPYKASWYARARLPEGCSGCHEIPPISTGASGYELP